MGHQRRVALGVRRPVALFVIPRCVVDVVRLVGRVVAEEEEERAVLVAVDELYGVVGRDLRVMAHVGVVGVLVDVDERVAVESVVGVVVRRVRVDGGDGPAVELVETPVVGSRLRVVAVEVPFVHQTGAVARLREHRA